MLAHITYLSEESMDAKFGRRLREKERYGYDFSTDFEVESYLHHQSESFIKRFDANSYLYITKAIDYFDLHRDYGSLEDAFRSVEADMLVLSFSSDWLFPTSQSREIVRALTAAGKSVTFCEIPSPYGHDAFLLRNELMEAMIGDFLSRQLERT
jgi:homoserine O-acetyltransferase/O-succinyltransferase